MTRQVSMLHLIGTELRQQLHSLPGLCLFCLHLLVSLAVTLWVWPEQVWVTGKEPPVGLAIWLQAESTVLSYIAITRGARIFGPKNELEISDWINFTDIGVPGIVFGKAVSCLLYCAFLLGTSLPAGIILHSFSLVSPAYLICLLLPLTLWVMGFTLIGICWYLFIDTPGLRKLVVNLTFIMLVLGTIVIGTTDQTPGLLGRLIRSMSSASPVFAINQLLVDQSSLPVYDTGVQFTQIQAAFSRLGVNLAFWVPVTLIALIVSALLTRRQRIITYMADTGQ